MALTAQQIFEEKIAQKIKDNAEKIKNLVTVYQFNLTGEEQSTWTLDLTKPGGEISQGASPNAKCTVTISVQHLSDIIEKKLNPQMAFITGKLKVSGDMGLALKLGNIL